MSKYTVNGKDVRCVGAEDVNDVGTFNLRVISYDNKACDLILKVNFLLKYQKHMLHTLHLRVKDNSQNCPEFILEFDQVMKNLLLLENVISDNNYNGSEEKAAKQLIVSLKKLELATKAIEDLETWFAELKYSASFLGVVSVLPVIGYLIYSLNQNSGSAELAAASFVGGIAVAGLIKSSEYFLGYTGSSTEIIETALQNLDQMDALLGKICEVDFVG